MKKLKDKKIVLIAIFIIILSSGIFILLKKEKNEKLYLNEYDYISAEKTDVIGTATLNGQISANNPIGIFVDKKLKVREVPVKNGDYVEKGQLLVSFDDDEKNKIERSIERENINLEKIKRNLKTVRELYNIGGVSLEELKVLEGDYRVSQLNLEELKEVLSKTAKELRSPVAGVISNLKAQKNYLVDTDNSLMEVIDLDDLKIIIEIPEYNSTMIKLGDRVKIKLESSDDDKLYEGEIKKISKLSNVSNLTSENVLEAEVKPMEIISNLVPGFKIKATVDLKDTKENLVIPKISIISENGLYYVYVLGAENKIIKKEIEIENVTGSNAIVKSGLSIEEKIIASPDARLKNGIKLLNGENNDNKS